MKTATYDPACRFVGNYLPLDGTVEFYGRINVLADASSVVLDLGAGRGGWKDEPQCAWKQSLRDLRRTVRELIGADVDPAVLTNPTTTRNVLICDGQVQGVPDHSIDIVIADYVLEHIEDVAAFASEVHRVLRPDGWFCARTPHRLHYVSLAARLIHNAKHAAWLRRLQPGRQSQDVFRTHYKMNTLREMTEAFPAYQNFSYLYSTEPQYFFGSRLAFVLLSAIHRLLPQSMTSNVLVFMRKPQ